MKQRTRKGIRKGFDPSCKYELIKISKFLERGDVNEYLKNHPEIKVPDLKKSREYLAEVIKEYVDGKKINLRSLFSSKNEIYIPLEGYGRLMKLLVLKSDNENDREALRKEMGITARLYELLETKYAEEGFLVPNPIDVIMFEGKPLYAMERVHGETLRQKIEGKAEFKTDLEKIIDFLALLHINIPKISEVKTLRVDAQGKITKYLDELVNKGFEEKSKHFFVENYAPILKQYEEATWVFNKDATPENWIINQRAITAIDIEDKGFVPIEYDLAGLLEYGGYFGDDEKKVFLEKYVSSRKKRLGEESLEGYQPLSELRYFNAVIDRAVSFISTWLSHEKKSTYNLFPDVLNNALRAIKKIKEQYNNYYDYYKLNYEGLERGLKDLEEYTKNTLQLNNQ